MAWTVPQTWTANVVLTAAQLNEQIRDNQLETMPGKAIGFPLEGTYFTSSGLNQITKRQFNLHVVSTSQSTASTVFTDLATVGPQIAVTTGVYALVIVTAQISNSSAGQRSYMSWTTAGVGESNTTSLIATSATAGNPHRASAASFVDNLTPGSNTFTAKYRVDGGTATFRDRQILVMPL